MKAVILAGGLGTRLAEETVTKPKPMVEVGGKPILWHIMKIYAAHGVTDFVVCLGYKGYVIKEWFNNLRLHNADVTFDLRAGTMEVLHENVEPWRVTLVETGEKTMTGGRLKRVGHLLQNEDAFCFTYGDGVGNVDIAETIRKHRASGRIALLTAAQPGGRFGALGLDGDYVRSFQEKPKGDGSWVNAGFFVLTPEAIDYIQGDETTWEREPLETLAQEGQLVHHKHEGFWQPMDKLADKNLLEELWVRGNAPWRVWPEEVPLRHPLRRIA